MLVQGVSGERGGLGYFGLSYALANQSRLNIVRVDKGNGCVTPNNQTVQNRTYPISRGLYMYVKKSSFKRTEVQKFIQYILNNEKAIAVKSKFVPLTPTQLKNAKRLFEVRGAEREEHLALQRVTLPPARAALPESRPRPFPAPERRRRRTGRTTRRRGRTSG